MSGDISPYLQVKPRELMRALLDRAQAQRFLAACVSASDGFKARSLELARAYEDAALAASQNVLPFDNDNQGST